MTAASFPVDIAVLQSIVWPLMKDVDVIHMLRCNHDSYHLLPHYQIETGITFAELIKYRRRHPLLTSIEITQCDQLRHTRVAAAKPTDVIVVKDKLDVLVNIAKCISLATVTYLDFYKQAIGDDGAIAIASALFKTKSLQKLNLKDNLISANGAEAIASALEHNTSLQELDLQHNHISHDGVKAIAVALLHNTSLQRLNIGLNEVTDESGNILAASLHVNTSLRYLNLHSNHITDDGVPAFATALCHNTSLQQLDLQYNRIRDAGARAIATALKHNKSARRVCLFANDISSDARENNFDIRLMTLPMWSTLRDRH